MEPPQIALPGHTMFVEIKSPEGFRTAFKLLQELRPELELKKYLATLKDMISTGYRMAAFVQDGEMVALAGFVVSTNFSIGKKMYMRIWSPQNPGVQNVWAAKFCSNWNPWLWRRDVGRCIWTRVCSGTRPTNFFSPTTIKYWHTTL
jgi:hypothetical protein